MEGCLTNSSYYFYKQYHSHPINKGIHFVCIPLIVFCLFNYLTVVKPNIIFVRNFFLNLSLNYNFVFILLNLLYFVYYSLFMNVKVASIMLVYFTLLYIASDYFVTTNTHWFIDTTYVFIFSWVLQFIGHYIEGIRPALMDSLSQTVLEAPVFSLEYIFPSIIDNM